jgi:hypothetical protein
VTAASLQTGARTDISANKSGQDITCNTQEIQTERSVNSKSC